MSGSYIVTECGELLLEAVVGDPGCVVHTQRGLVPVKELLADDRVLLSVQASKVPGLVMKKGE